MANSHLDLAGCATAYTVARPLSERPAEHVVTTHRRLWPSRSRIDLRTRLTLAHAVNRGTLAETMPLDMLVASGVAASFRRLSTDTGHRSSVRPRSRPGASGPLQLLGALDVACLDDDLQLIEPVIEGWREELDMDVRAVTWTLASAPGLGQPRELAPIYFTRWLPGYADPEYFLRLFHSESKTNEGGFSYPAFDDLIERARQERLDRDRLELFHSADRMAVAERVAVIPLVYGRSLAIVKPWIRGWWEFGKSCSNFADLCVDPSSPEPDILRRRTRPSDDAGGRPCRENHRRHRR